MAAGRSSFVLVVSNDTVNVAVAPAASRSGTMASPLRSPVASTWAKTPIGNDQAPSGVRVSGVRSVQSVAGSWPVSSPLPVKSAVSAQAASAPWSATTPSDASVRTSVASWSWASSSGDVATWR